MSPKTCIRLYMVLYNYRNKVDMWGREMSHVAVFQTIHLLVPFSSREHLHLIPILLQSFAM